MEHDILCAWGRQIGKYNPNTCYNGGGYWQFEGGVMFRLQTGAEVCVEVQDTSCGDFGTRFAVAIGTDSHNWLFCCGTMDDVEGCGEYAAEQVKSASGVLGIDASELVDAAFSAACTISWAQYERANTAQL